jgi:hypothetical protein
LRRFTLEERAVTVSTSVLWEILSRECTARHDTSFPSFSSHGLVDDHSRWPCLAARCRLHLAQLFQLHAPSVFCGFYLCSVRRSASPAALLPCQQRLTAVLTNGAIDGQRIADRREIDQALSPPHKKVMVCI